MDAQCSSPVSAAKILLESQCFALLWPLVNRRCMQKHSTCILALPHEEMACQAEPAPSEMKLRGKLQLQVRVELRTYPRASHLIKAELMM